MRIIKKYNNRKLYDTKLSKYINLDSIIDYVKNDVNLVVIETKGGQVVTDDILKNCLSHLHINREFMVNIIRNTNKLETKVEANESRS